MFHLDNQNTSSLDVLDAAHMDFAQFLVDQGLKDCPSQLWNADEAGFPLCPKTGQVLSMLAAKNVYGVTGDSKEQITCLCAATAAGDALPPMEVFAGECFPNAYFEHSHNGWINTEVYFGWLANHFPKLVKVRPVLLLVDGRGSHIDVDVSKFCLNNEIFAYCLPPHSSHILQLLDVFVFFCLLKVAGVRSAASTELKDLVYQPLRRYFLRCSGMLGLPL